MMCLRPKVCIRVTVLNLVEHRRILRGVNISVVFEGFRVVCKTYKSHSGDSEVTCSCVSVIDDVYVSTSVYLQECTSVYCVYVYTPGARTGILRINENTTMCLVSSNICRGYIDRTNHTTPYVIVMTHSSGSGYCGELPGTLMDRRGVPRISRPTEVDGHYTFRDKGLDLFHKSQ